MQKSKMIQKNNFFIVRDPKTWVNPIQSRAVHSFQATRQEELTFQVGQIVYVAPKEIQQSLNLLNTGWALASTNKINSGFIPVNYIRGPQQMAAHNSQEQAWNSAQTVEVEGGVKEEILPEKLQEIPEEIKIDENIN